MRPADNTDSTRRSPRILVIGYGNPGHRDDGLGPAFAARLEALGFPGVTVDSDYQLSIEHAERVARHDVAVFADAAADMDGSAPFYLRSVQPATEAVCFTHSISPQAVLHLAAQCFDARPRGVASRDPSGGSPFICRGSDPGGRSEPRRCTEGVFCRFRVRSF